MKNIKVFTLVFLGFALLAAPALAQFTQPGGLPCGGTDQPPCFGNITGQNSVYELINKIFRFFFWLIISLSMLTLLWAAFWYVWARGDTGKIDEAKKAIVFAVVGLVIAALAYAVPAVVTSVLNS